MDADFTTPRAEEFLALVTARLPEKTLRHVLSVTRFMLTFAQEAGISDEQSVTAGLLHDLCKPCSKEDLREKAISYGLTEHLDNPNLLHGPAAAAECRIDLGIEDEAVLEAIAYHTTAKGDWNPVGCALYVADFAEPLRTQSKAQHARALLTSEGYSATLQYVANTRLAYVREKFGVNKDTEAFVAWLNESTI